MAIKHATPYQGIPIPAATYNEPHFDAEIYIAGENLGGNRVVVLNDSGVAMYADKDDAMHINKILGITTGASASLHGTELQRIQHHIELFGKLKQAISLEITLKGQLSQILSSETSFSGKLLQQITAEQVLKTQLIQSITAEKPFSMISVEPLSEKILRDLLFMDVMED